MLITFICYGKIVFEFFKHRVIFKHAHTILTQKPRVIQIILYIFFHDSRKEQYNYFFMNKIIFIIFHLHDF